MDHAVLVGSLERVGDLSSARERLGECERPRDQPVVKRRTFDELQHERWTNRRLFEPVDRGDIGVVQRSQDARLASEPCKALGIGSDVLGQDLERDVAVERRVTRAVDLAHAARADGR